MKLIKPTLLFILFCLTNKIGWAHAAGKESIATLNDQIRLNKIKERDTSHYFSIGVIPYQLFSRSSGIYAKIGFKKLALEYRPTYTYPTKYLTNVLTHEWYYYQGINNNVILYFGEGRRTSLGVLVGYKYWWYTNTWIPKDGTSTWSSYIFDNRQSAYMHGPCAGAEMAVKFSKNKFDGALFFNTTFTYFTGKRTVYETEQDPTYNNKYYPKSYSINTFWFNMAVGVKLGYRKAIR